VLPECAGGTAQKKKTIAVALPSAAAAMRARSRRGAMASATGSSAAAAVTFESVACIASPSRQTVIDAFLYGRTNGS
jgi:hypothetical protein